MKLRLLEFVRCPVCLEELDLCDRETDASGEVVSGRLACRGCKAWYPIDEGIPRLRLQDRESDTTSRTANSFGYLWARSKVGDESQWSSSYHYEVIESRLNLSAPRGFVLDAGCGDGIDLVNQARRPGVEVIGVDLSDGGVRTSYARAGRLPNAHVVQADLSRLPFAGDTFHFVYSYGVLHHMTSPEAGINDIVRTVRPDGRVVGYVYEDFAERERGWRWLLSATNWTRVMTTRLPHPVLYALCAVGAPAMFLLFALPSKVAKRIPGLERFGATFPFRHATGPFSLIGDLYDRYSAPVEERYSRTGALALFAQAGLESLQIAQERGWIVSGTKARRRNGHKSDAFGLCDVASTRS